MLGGTCTKGVSTSIYCRHLVYTNSRNRYNKPLFMASLCRRLWQKAISH